MCTVTFVPFNSGKFLLTQNRDEGFERAHSLNPKVYKKTNQSLLYPKDPVGNGTWMATSNKGLTACLLNGAFEKHKRNLPYAKSRGIILLDLFEYEHVKNFIKAYTFNNIEPFTIIAIDNNTEGYEIVWDENKVHCKKFNTTKPQIWSSSTLYTAEQKNERHQWFFDKAQSNSLKGLANVLNFHFMSDETNSDNSILMKRERVGTVSITSVQVTDNNTEMSYIDVINKLESKVSLVSSVLN